MKLKDKTVKTAVIIGILLIAVIFFSSLFKPKEEKEIVAEKPAAAEEYTMRLQAQLKETLENVEGVGNAQVLITLQNSGQNVYVTEENINTDKETNAEQSVSERHSSQTNMLLVEDENGRRQALLKTTLEPTIKGAVIVCDGGDNPETVMRVTELVKAALNLNSTRICVSKSVK